MYVVLWQTAKHGNFFFIYFPLVSFPNSPSFNYPSTIHTNTTCNMTNQYIIILHNIFPLLLSLSNCNSATLFAACLGTLNTFLKHLSQILYISFHPPSKRHTSAPHVKIFTCMRGFVLWESVKCLFSDTEPYNHQQMLDGFVFQYSP